MIFILTRYSRTVSTFDGDFEVYSASKHSYKFDEKSLELVYVSMPEKKGGSKCLIF